jgi:hypothetical protein
MEAGGLLEVSSFHPRLLWACSMLGFVERSGVLVNRVAEHQDLWGLVMPGEGTVALSLGT